MFKDILNKLFSKKDLTPDEVRNAMDSIMTGDTPAVQVAAFLTAMRMKGETAQEVGNAAAIMRRHATFIDAGTQAVVDTCGTGGDGASTFNISTTTAFVVAGAGICVAKHGNRAVSSQCGSADVLAALGVNINAEAYIMEECIQEHGIGFLFAQTMHPAMKNVAAIRKELGVRTIFNMLGPLSNPAAATGQVLGVFAPELTEMFAQALKTLGCRRAFVVHGEDGLDEITPCGMTRVCELRNDSLRTYELSADILLGESFDMEDLAGGDAQFNAKILRGVLDNSIQGAPRAAVLLNAAAAIICGEKSDSMEDALKLADKSLSSGAALEKLEILINESN